MEIFAGLSVALLVLTALVIAVKTLRLWLRTRGRPELLLSLMLIAATVLGYPLAVASMQLSPAEMWPIHIASQLVMTFGYACLLLFTRDVFRPNTLWATCLVGLTLSVFLAANAVYIAELMGESPRAPQELFGLTLLTTAPIALSYFWTTAESLLYYRQLRLRLQLGLTEAVVANRVLLWGLMGLAAGTAVLLNLGALLLGYFMAPVVITISSCLGLVHAGCLFLAFHPPAWYRAWLEEPGAVAQHA